MMRAKTIKTMIKALVLVVATAIITTIALMHNIQVVEVECEQGTSYVLIRVLGNDFVYEIDNEE